MQANTIQSYRWLLTCLLAFVVTSISLHGQRGFAGKITAGFNASQIQGDQLAGYDKLGLNLGGEVSFALNDRFDMGMQFLFTQKGSQSEISLGQDQFKTNLNYIEIPVMIIIKDWYLEEEDYHKVKAHAGFSYARLFDVSSSNGLFEGDIGNFKNYDFALFIGASYGINRKWEGFARYTNSVIQIYLSDDLETDGLINYLWTFGLAYKI